jgi:hypothetical protein
MELIEKIPLIRLQYLTTLTFSDFKSLGLFKTDSKNDDDRKQNYNYMMSYSQGLIKAKGEMKRAYTYTDATPLEVGGRLYSGLSIQGISSKIRGFLLNGETSDIDMRNAHPVILRYICKLNNLSCPNLEYYINNRDEILAKYDETGKTEFLKAVNSDKSNKKIKDKFYKDFDKECKEIQQFITKLKEYEHIVKTVPATKKYNWIGSAINRILCVYENKILQEIIGYFIREQIEICALMFDGLMVYGDYYNDNELLEKLEKIINEKFEGLNMRLSYKEHKTGFINIPDNFEIIDKKKNNYEGLTIVRNELEAYEIICDRLKNKLINCQNILWFRGDDYVWRNDIKYVDACISSFIINSGILRFDKDEKPCDFVQNYKTSNNIKNIVVKEFLSKTNNDDWFKTKKDTSKNKILFNNGFYDFNKKEFLSLDKLDDNIYFFEKCSYDFNFVTNKDIEDIRKRFFTEPLGVECGKYFSTMISRAIAGDVMKRFVFCVGAGNTGKSTLTQAIEMTCGGYFGTFNAGCLAYKETSNDEAQQLRWLMLLMMKRIVISNEIKINHKLDANAIKKMSSGGLDKIVARGHGGNETECPFTALPIANMNDACEIAPKDDALNNRVKSFTYSKVYVSEVTDETSELLADPNVNSEIYTLEFRIKFMNLLISDYLEFLHKGEPNEPNEMIQSKDDWFGLSKNSIINSVLEDFEFTGDVSDYVRSSDLIKWIEQKKLKITMTKLGLEINKYTKNNKLEDKIHKKDKKMGGKTIKVWVGMKLLFDDDN